MTTYLEDLQCMDKDQLVNLAYNQRVSDMADYDDRLDEYDPHGHGKRIPYIGWFWRDTDFVNCRISIGDNGEFIGVMENNKWDYPQREMTPDEAATFIVFLERVYAERARGGIVSKTIERVEAVCVEMWDWFQTLHIESHDSDR